MASVTFGDIFFIALVGAGIYLILSFVNRTKLDRAVAAAPAASDAQLLAVLCGSKTVAVVGASPDPTRPSYRVMEYLLKAGYTVYPVNPHAQSILDRPAFKSLEDIPCKPDVVDVFRSPEHAPSVAREAVAKGARVLWLQEGVVSPTAMTIALEGGLTVVMDRCMLKEHRRLAAESRA